jgi:hypothetical protein
MLYPALLTASMLSMLVWIICLNVAQDRLFGKSAALDLHRSDVTASSWVALLAFVLWFVGPQMVMDEMLRAIAATIGTLLFCGIMLTVGIGSLRYANAHR